MMRCDTNRDPDSERNTGEVGVAKMENMPGILTSAMYGVWVLSPRWYTRPKLLPGYACDIMCKHLHMHVSLKRGHGKPG